MAAWLANPRILERIHAEQYRTKHNKFESFFTSRRAPLATLENQYGQVTFADFNDLISVRPPGR